MSFLHTVAKFTKNRHDLKRIYILQVRSKLERSAVLWHSSLTKKCSDRLERVQKSALKVILGSEYVDYAHALQVLGLQSLEERRKYLCLKFAKKCQQVEKLKSMFPKKQNLHNMLKRYEQKFVIRDAWTERHRRSSIPFMQKLLNNEDKERKNILKQIDSFVPVNNGFL